MATVSIAQMDAGGTLRQGDTGTAVPQLRTYLATAGYAVSSTSSSFDGATLTKVLVFQTDFGAEPDGIVGSITWNMLKKYHGCINAPVTSNPGPNFKYGPNAPKSTGLQTFQTHLSNIGYGVGTPDGVFGKSTLKAVFQFQLQHNLTVDGIAGSGTTSKASTINGFSGGKKTWGVPLTGFACNLQQSGMTDSGAVARCMYGESNNDIAGMQAVAQVISNRIRLSGYPSTVKGVVFQDSNQFTSMYRINGTNVAPDRSSSKWNTVCSALGSDFSTSATYHATLKSNNCVRFRRAGSGDATTSSSLLAGGNYFWW